MTGFRRRLAALTRKETWQLLRDPSSIAIGVLLPIILILIFGYGLSLDVRIGMRVRSRVTIENDAPLLVFEQLA